MEIRRLINMTVFFFENRLLEGEASSITFWPDWEERDEDGSRLLAAFVDWFMRSPAERLRAKKERAQRQLYKALARDLFAIQGVSRIIIRNFDVSVMIESSDLWRVHGPEVAEVLRRHLVTKAE